MQVEDEVRRQQAIDHLRRHVGEEARESQAENHRTDGKSDWAICNPRSTVLQFFDPFERIHRYRVPSRRTWQGGSRIRNADGRGRETGPFEGAPKGAVDRIYRNWRRKVGTGCKVLKMQG